MTFQDNYLRVLADVSGKLRHYKRLFGRDGAKIVFCSAFIRRLDVFLFGVKCDYSASEKRDFDGFVAFADGLNNDEEYVALDHQLYDLLFDIKDKEVCRCRMDKIVL